MDPTTSELINGGWYERLDERAWAQMRERIEAGLPPYESASDDPTAGVSGDADVDPFEEENLSHRGEVCVINGTGSSGALMGHATGDAWTEVVVTGTKATGNKITGENAQKTGILFGTSGVGQTAYEKDGGVWFSVEESGNTLFTADGTQLTGVDVHEIGRIGSSGGTVTVTAGGAYSGDPTLTSDPATGTIATSEDCEVTSANGG